MTLLPTVLPLPDTPFKNFSRKTRIARNGRPSSKRSIFKSAAYRTVQAVAAISATYRTRIRRSNDAYASSRNSRINILYEKENEIASTNRHIAVKTVSSRK